jgi:glycosyltransferase involved in cell wall biosynthesis
MVLLIGNYPADRQQSMQRFATMMLHGLTVAGVPAEIVQPEPHLGNFRFAGDFVAKWLGYLDKFVLFPRRLRRKLKSAAVVHICDHSNAMYANRTSTAPVVVTCHDLLAVRGALGEQTDCPASTTGKLLQRWILSGLRHATAIACDSRATFDDAQRLVAPVGDRPLIEQVTLALSYPYRRLPRDDARARLSAFPQLQSGAPFALHVGSNLRRKNRDGVVRIFARCIDKWNGLLVFAGDALNSELRSLVRERGVAHRIVEVPGPSNELLEALYNCATALLYPSRFEGFGWPIIEAHACGCPVITSDSGPLPEVSGDAALLRAIKDEAGFASDLLRLTSESEYAQWSERALRNAERFEPARMIRRYIELYRSAGAQL